VIKSFKSKGLAELWEHDRTARINAKFHARIRRALDRLDVAVVPQEMNVAGYRFHALHEHKPTRYTVHINGPWCLTFEFDDGHAYRVDFDQYH
jgi:toxin HigB-1